MKKFIGILFLICFSCFITSNYAQAANPEYSAEISALRHVKNAQIKPINAQIKTIKQNIENYSLNTSISESARNKKLEIYQKELLNLEMKKVNIEKKYKEDKKQIKSKYKMGGMI